MQKNISLETQKIKLFFVLVQAKNTHEKEYHRFTEFILHIHYTFGCTTRTRNRHLHYNPAHLVLRSGGYKEMSSILADQWRSLGPGGGSCGVSANENEYSNTREPKSTLKIYSLFNLPYIKCTLGYSSWILTRRIWFVHFWKNKWNDTVRICCTIVQTQQKDTYCPLDKL